MGFRKYQWQTIALLVVISFALGAVLFSRQYSAESGNEDSMVSAPQPEVIYPHMIPPRSTLYNVLRDLNVTSQTIQEIVTATKPVIDLGRLRAGTQFRLMHITDPSSELTGIEFSLSPLERILVQRSGETWIAEKITETVETRAMTFRGVVNTTLWESALEADMDPNLIVQLSEIFAWQIDFSREVRVNDRWRLSIEQKLVRGKPIGWGSISAAEFVNNGVTYNAVLFQTGPEQTGYYAADGTSLKKMFLKSPIRFGRVTSGFTMRRFHPILKISRPHKGVDYGAPVGTPVRSVGSGTVSAAGWMGGGGKTIKIRHNSTYATAYLHLSRIENGVRPGAKVAQGQVIGYVGTTGMSTGPHLHFEFSRNGQVINPLGQKFPSAEPVPPKLMAAFSTKTQELLGQLPTWDGLDFITMKRVGTGVLFPQAHGRVVE